MDEKLILPNLMYSYFEQIKDEYYKYKLNESDRLFGVYDLSSGEITNQKFDDIKIVKDLYSCKEYIQCRSYYNNFRYYMKHVILIGNGERINIRLPNKSHIRMMNFVFKIEGLYVLYHILELHIFSLKNKTVSKREYEKFIIVKENNSKKLFGCVNYRNILDKINIDTGEIEESYSYSNLNQLDSVLGIPGTMIKSNDNMLSEYTVDEFECKPEFKCPF